MYLYIVIFRTHLHVAYMYMYPQAVSSEQALQLSEMEGEREELTQNLDNIRAELEEFKSQVATEKKEALEQ